MSTLTIGIIAAAGLAVVVIIFLISRNKSNNATTSGSSGLAQSGASDKKTPSLKAVKSNIKNVENLSVYDLPAPFDLAEISKTDVTTDDINDRLTVISKKLHLGEDSIRAILRANKLKNTADEKLSENLIDSSRRSLELQRSLIADRSSDPDVQKRDRHALQHLVEGNTRQAEHLLEESEKLLMESAKKEEGNPEKMLDVAAKRGQRAEVNVIELNFHRAGNHYRQAYRMVPEQYKEAKIGYLLRAGTNFNNAELYDDALALSEAALADSESSFGKSHPFVAETLNNLGEVLVRTKRYDRAITAFQRALTILETHTGKDSVEVGKTLSSLADTYVSKQELESAVPNYERSLNIFGNQLGNVNDLAISTLNNLVNIFRVLKRFDEGEAILSKYLTHLEKSKRTDSSEIKIAVVVNSLAMLYFDSNRPSNARPLFERALGIIERVYGSDHPELARTLNNLANLESKGGNFERSAELLRRSLRIVKAHYPPDHPNIALVTKNFNVAAVRARGGKTETAGK